ncbi:hypothetical protein [Spirosoma oryzicola]|uniref:hypothetical protein n=1 Tax=Spirosoma oryzicola TaxID=2898794 RepID=UPI001E59F521|nr:hypothetical protein [Spirosoma oryzicola]UHG91785.1 hypothetical protein LQ777_02540 [Spirosoma oryzicola]
MRKVILAVLVAATKEGTQCSVAFNASGNLFETSGQLRMPEPTQTILELWRGGDKSMITLAIDENDMSCGTNDGKYEITIGGACITFQDSFQRDPFTVTTNA